MSFEGFDDYGIPAQKRVVVLTHPEHPPVKRVMASRTSYPGYMPRVEPLLAESQELKTYEHPPTVKRERVRSRPRAHGRPITPLMLRIMETELSANSETGREKEAALGPGACLSDIKVNDREARTARQQ